MATVAPNNPTGERPLLRTCHFEWAAKQLDMDTQPADAADSRNVALQRLQRWDFETYESSSLAVRILAAGAEATWNEAELAQLRSIDEQDCRAEVRDFHRRYFDLPPRQRRQEYLRLGERCHAHPRLERLLEALEKGLNISRNVDHLGRTELKCLGSAILSVYTLWPTDRGHFHRTRLARFRDQPLEWRVAARELQHLDPRLATLGGDWFLELTAGSLTDPWYAATFPHDLPKTELAAMVTYQPPSFLEKWGVRLLLPFVIFSSIYTYINKDLYVTRKPQTRTDSRPSSHLDHYRRFLNNQKPTQPPDPPPSDSPVIILPP